MADKSSRRDENVAGSWYVDENCISCGLCAEEAPDNFEIDDGGLAFVKKQPSGASEIEASTTALENCPADSIGNDG